MRFATLVAGLLLFASSAAAQEYKDATRLGGATAFYRPSLTDVASLKRMAQRRGIADDVRTVLREAGIPDLSDAVLSVLSGATSADRVTNCADASPVEGALVDCNAPVGSTLEWMSYRPVVGGKPVPSRLEKVRWAGRAPYAAFLFRITNSNRIYTFIVPKACGNVALMSASTLQPAPPVPTLFTPDPPQARQRGQPAQHRCDPSEIPWR